MLTSESVNDTFESFSLGSETEVKTDCKFDQERREVCSCCIPFTA